MVFRLLILLLIIVITAITLWRLIKDIPEVRLFLKLDSIKSVGDLAKKIDGVDQDKSKSDEEKVKNFIKKEGNE